jgi:cell division septation protein DedD/nucleoid DNA-binding protein
MRKEELLKIFARKAGISYKEAVEFYNKFVERAIRVFRKGESVRIPEFGEFKVRKRKGRIIFNRFKNVEEYVKAKLTVIFSPYHALSDKVNVKYRHLKSMPVKVEEGVSSPGETEVGKEFSLTFFESETPEKIDEHREAEREEYLKLPEVVSEDIKTEGVDIDVSVSNLITKKAEETPSKKNQEGKMPEFNLTDESGPQKGTGAPQEGEKRSAPKRIFDDTATSRETESIIYSYDEERPSRAGLWIFIGVIFLIFIGGVVFLLNQYGYINLWGGKSEETQAEIVEPEEIVVTTPEIIEPETPAEEVRMVEEVKPPSVVEKPERRTPGNYVVQVAAFQNRELADKYANTLKRKGFNAFVEKAFVEWKGGNWYRVRIGFFSSKEEADEMADKIKKMENLPKVWVSRVKRRTR